MKTSKRCSIARRGHAYMALLIHPTWQELFTVLAPWSVEHDESEFLFLDAGREVVSGKLNHSRWGRCPVGVIHFSHVPNDSIVGPGARVGLLK